MATKVFGLSLLVFLDRQPLYQLYFLLNQANIFGNEQSYLQARSIVDRLLEEH
ncbi:Fructosamine kinase [Providencia rustigianii]|nr:Fructosamine kinase [Providencia rustigianii]